MITCFIIEDNRTSFFIRVENSIKIYHSAMNAGRWGELSRKPRNVIIVPGSRGTMRRVLSNITKVPRSPPSRTKENSRGNRAEPSLTRLVNRVMSRFRCWFPFTVANESMYCSYTCETSIGYAYVYRRRKLQRTFAPCTGVRASIDVVAKAKTAAVRTWLTRLSERKRQSRFESS